MIDEFTASVEMRFHYVYVLHSGSTSRLYIGMTSNLKRRLTEHQENRASATAQRGPWKLIYYEAYLMSGDAEGRERFLKSGAGHRFLDKQMKFYFVGHPRHRRP